MPKIYLEASHISKSIFEETVAFIPYSMSFYYACFAWFGGVQKRYQQKLQILQKKQSDLSSIALLDRTLGLPNLKS